MDFINKDKVYLKCKHTVKTWEKDFKTKHARTPSKLDIKEAPAKIKYAYKKYFQLKSSALETSLAVCDFEEESIISQSPEKVRNLENTYEFSHPQSELLPDLPTGQELEQLLSNHEHTKSKSLENHSTFVDNVSKKIFQSKKFSLRNPRKISISKNRSITDIENSIIEKTNNETGTDVFIAEEKDQTNDTFTFGSSSTCTALNLFTSMNNMMELVPKLRQVDEAWFKRATGLTISQKEATDTNTKAEFGLSNVKVAKLNDKPIDYIENSESEGDDNILISKLKPALKKRKLDNAVNSKEKINQVGMHDQAASEPSHCVVSSDKKTKTISKHRKSQKMTAECSEQQPPSIAEFLPFGLEKDIVPRHSDITNILNTFSTDVVIENKSETSYDAKENNEREILNKIKSGTLNENYVKINIEKKVFVRGKKNINYSKYKKQQWKDKKALHGGMEFPECGKMKCFKCGLPGHMARYCTAHIGDTLLPLHKYDENTLPSLENMQDIIDKETNNMSLSDQLSLSIYKSSKIPESVLNVLAATEDIHTNVKPIYTYDSLETPTELYETLQKFGHERFRSGQEETIKRILSGMSTLLILSTGGGKSLCYQLPAYIYSQYYKCITLVISPLVSLMEDQVLSMPEFLKAGCLHTNQPPSQRQKIIQCLKNQEINVLLISPEALVSVESSTGFSGIFKSLPQIAFACIDEVHCVSQWSHNFRPSYLMICRVLQEKLNVKCILGLTATASQQTVRSIISHINIPDDITGVITNPTLPDNLCLSVSFEKNKDQALVAYLKSKEICYSNSIIVYCIRRDECERVAALLRSCLQEPNKLDMERQHKRKRMSYIVEAYHAGMSGAQRKKIQKHFMDGTLKIIVATVAFGMGINKSNIRCIIHYNMPSSFESYVQEVGRAGRDGQNAYCHVFMNDSNNDKNELLKHIHANSVDRPTVRKLLQKVFLPCKCGQSDGRKELPSTSTNTSKRCKGHEVGIPIDSTVEELDLSPENISTLLCYVELHHKKYIKVLNNSYTMCRISSYGGPDKILEAAKICCPLAMAYLLLSKKDPDILAKNILEFNVIEVAAAIGWESGVTKYHLKNLEWNTEDGVPKRSLLKVELNTLGFKIRAPGDLSPIELDSILDDIHGSVILQEKTMLYQVEEIYKAFTTVAFYSFENLQSCGTSLDVKSNELKCIIKKYFQRNEALPVDITFEQRPLDVNRVTSDIRALMSSYKDCNFTGRSIARIFQGISSPNYPAIVWGRTKFWRSHIHEDFYGIIKIATQQILEMKMT
ncbi:ATP-dependent DNA helicase Q4 [Achroia grisella]|uniref:ATP-dependent DNA helicase Q4 n=1 Tax=Achroia grisella TaxID=688607 RepID=UPI0027D32D13|nr:ATP-dependent DNA helicase Q4 [Achroia grisella]